MATLAVTPADQKRGPIDGTAPTRSVSETESGLPQCVFVDLDGTLLRGDLLWEGLRLLLRQHPGWALRAPLWLAQGKAPFKCRLAELVSPDAQSLPYRPEVIEYLEARRAGGAQIILASASPSRWVRAVADEVGLIDDVIATDPGANQSGERKLASIRSRIDQAPFEYIGDDAVDLPLWEAAARATAVAPTAGARRALASLPDHHEIPVSAPSNVSAILRAIRPHQWAKNGLLFAPLLLAHQLLDVEKLAHVMLAFVGFCLVASAGYVLNDLTDVDADRVHPRKRHRPIASGALSLPGALRLLVSLVLGAALVCAFLTWPAAAMVAAYGGLTLTYSFFLKQRMLLDVLLLAGLYTHRILTGGIAAEVPVSPWLLAFSMFLFLSLALVKRFVELSALADRGASDRVAAGRAYRAGDRGLVEMMGLASGYIAVMVLSLFISSDDVSRLYRTPMLLWLMCPVMFYWISRVWLLAHRGELDEDPVLFATTDPNSYVAGLVLVAILVAAAW